jgi:hypothetical protein
VGSGSITYILTGFDDFDNVNVHQASCLSSYNGFIQAALCYENKDSTEITMVLVAQESSKSALKNRIIPPGEKTKRVPRKLFDSR